MTKSCPLKAAFRTSKLDEIQSCWRDGADVTQKTKSTIQSYAQEKYKDILEDILEDADEPISIKSIENAIDRVRKKLGIINPKGRRNSPLKGSSKHQILSDFAGCTMNLEAKDMSNKDVYPQIGEQSMLVSIKLFDEIKRLVCQYSIQEIKKAISIIEGSFLQNSTKYLSEGKIVEPTETVEQHQQEKAELSTPAEAAEVQECTS